jgi:hypothetical protein
MEHELLVESEDTAVPLICQSGVAAPNGTPVAVEQQRVVKEASSLLQTTLGQLSSKRRQPSKSETSDVLRETCQNLSDLAMSLEQTWQKAHPGEPQPSWPVEAIPEEELARIGWDFHANRVKMLNAGSSFWNSIGYLIQADQSRTFAKPPSAAEVAEALSRTKQRLDQEMRSNPTPPQQW